jgi:tRNA nucleotidyltransferase/poly(A) polymerase
MTELHPDKQRRFAIEVVEQLRAAGFIAYWAGGCVRDRFLGRTPGDYDVATNAKPDEIRRVFGERRTLAIGAAYGVIAVLGPREAGQVEVTTFRSDADYRDGRHPGRVVFSSPEEDAQRRDFTINGMFFDPLGEQVIDFVGGQEDLQRRTIRAIGEPRARITEDKLRMLRAVRFAARFDFELDPATAGAIREMATELTVVSAERIAAEMEAMLVDEHRARAMRLLVETGLLAVVLPEVGRGARGEGRGDGEGAGGREQGAGEEWGRTLLLLDALVAPTFALALAGLWVGVGDSRIAEFVGRRWKLAKRDFERAGWLLAHRTELAEARRSPWSRLQPVLIHEGIGELLSLGDAMAAIGELDRDELIYCRERLSLPPEKLNPPPLLTGDDLIQLGIPRGKLYATLLHKIRDAQLDGKIADRAEAIALVRESI